MGAIANEMLLSGDSRSEKRRLPDFRHLLAEGERMRFEMLCSQIAVSHTMASIATIERPGSSFRRACYLSAQKGYGRVVQLLCRRSLLPSHTSVLNFKLDELRAALMSVEPGTEPEARNGDNGSRKPILTARETEVLRLIAEGHATKQIAALLGIRFKTAVCHRYRLMDKLGIHELANLVRYAIREGLIRP